MKIESVLFDYGLTLVTYEYPRESLMELMTRVRPWLASALGRPPPTADFLLTEVLERLERDVIADTIEEPDYAQVYAEAWRRAGLDLPAELLWRIIDLEQQVWSGAVRLGPDTVPTLTALRRHGVRTCLCSNAIFPAELMRRQLADNGLSSLLDGAVFSSEVGVRKPHPEIYQVALAAIGAEPARTLFVGDNVEWDYRAPRRLGMRSVLFSGLRGEPTPAEVESVARLSDILRLL